MSQGGGLCRKCANTDPEQSEERFRAHVAALGGICLYEHWQNSHIQVYCRCRNGHDCYPRPSDVTQGQGICGLCWVDHSILYVTINDTIGEVKLGVTSNDERSRLGDHRRKGFHRLVYLLLNVDADPIEKALKAAVPLAGFKPLHGTEYFALEALPIILELAESFGYLNEVEAA